MLGVFGGREKEALNKKLLDAEQALARKDDELKVLTAKIKELQLANKNLELDSAGSAQKIASLEKEIKRIHSQLEAEQKSSKNAQDKSAADLQEQLKKLTKENAANYESFLAAKEVREKLKLEVKELQKELESAKKATQAEKEGAKGNAALEAELQKAKAQADEFRVNNEINYKNYLKIQATQKRDLVKIKDLKQEQDLLLLQITEAKDHINKHFLEVKNLKSLNQALSNKLKRLTANNPNYVDYGGIVLVSLDTVSETPQVLWKVTDYSGGAISLPEFYFRTGLIDGLAGIGIVQNPNDINDTRFFIPQLINKDAEQLDIFKSFTQEQWTQIQAATTVLGQMIKDGGRSLNSEIDLDFGFWQSSFTSLVENIRRLPNVFRYEKIKLKRELQNPDYEHLWIEFHNVVFGDFKVDKFELRIGASMIDRNGFSLLPKLEFPLVDGKHKPFESWFAESADDFGQKFELRFSLEKQVFDVKTFQKLQIADQKLIQVLSFVLPSAINKLIKSKVSIHRPWASWSGFVSETVAILLNQTRGLQAEANVNDKSTQQNLKNPPDLQNPVEASTSKAMQYEGSQSNGLGELSEAPVAAAGRALTTAPAVAPFLGRRSSDVVAAGRRKSDLVGAARTTAVDRTSGKQFVEAPTKLVKRKSVSVLVAKNTNNDAASSKSALKASKGVAKTSPKLSSKKSDPRAPNKAPIKSAGKKSEQVQHVASNKSKEQVGAS